MDKKEISDKLKPFLEIEDYRQSHINEVVEVCMDVFDNEIGSENFRQFFLHSVKIIRAGKDTPILGQDDIKKHIRGLIATLENDQL